MKSMMFVVNLIGLLCILSTTGFSETALAGANGAARLGAASSTSNNGPTVRRFENADTQGPAPPRREQTDGEEPGKKTFNLMIEGALREFIVYRPANLPVNRSTPVVFVFHGTGQSGEYFYEESGWREKADAEGFVAVFPTALKYRIFEETLVQHSQVLNNVHRFTAKWNFFDLESLLDPDYPNQKLQDDVKFVQVMVAAFKRYYTVNEDRIYATGFSNGAQFVGRLAVQMSDVFAAFTLCANARSFTREQAALTNVYTNAPFTPRPVFQVIGELDPKLTYGAKVTAFPMDESAAAPNTFTKEIIIKPWLGLLGLPDQYNYIRAADASLFQYGAAGATPEYKFSIVQGMRHVYPNGENFGFKIVDVFWPFMLQHHR